MTDRDIPSNLVPFLREVERQLDRYREALIEAQDGLGDQTDPDDVRTRIYLALRQSEYTGDRLRAEIARLATSGETADESGWMVERTTPSAPSWLSSVIPIRWNTNANAGIRFCRRQDACEVMEGIRPLEPSEPTMRVTEHIWCDMVHLAQSSPKTSDQSSGKIQREPQ